MRFCGITPHDMSGLLVLQRYAIFERAAWGWNGFRSGSGLCATGDSMLRSCLRYPLHTINTKRLDDRKRPNALE
jgi:hypothetical protein